MEINILSDSVFEIENGNENKKKIDSFAIDERKLFYKIIIFYFIKDQSHCVSAI